MPPRRPTPARTSSALPSLVSLLASAAAVEGCAPVECGAERIDEVARHGPRGAESLARGEVGQGMREVAIAIGVLPHGAARVDPRVLGGAPPPVTEAPPTPQPPGGIRAATPEPPTPPPGSSQPMSEGGVRSVRPHPPRPVSPPERATTRGDVRQVTPTPQK